MLVATFGSLRWGEAIALRRKDIDLDADTVRVRAVVVQRESGKLELGPPKSPASRRTVTVPGVITTELRLHLETYVAPSPTALVFTGAHGT